ncbi:LysR family transcriptional regulator [Citrifermentans bremense]|uniref:LysR family transcriptional regulator n=1 Tax=Citrifermentans bremense TaxID=60035 RepID=UPI000412DC2F|nr:LysR family transcriptional regulator [Citrifermentans bremense]
MDIEYLRTIITVLREKSFSKAATALNVTQSAVSHRVKFLEDHFGGRLIDRSGTELMPTDMGLRVLKKAERIVQLEDDLIEDVANLGGDRTLSIGTTVAFAVNHMSNIMNKSFLSHSEGANLKILVQHPKALLDGLKGGFFDITVIEHNGNLDFSGLKTFELPDDEMVFISNSAPELTSYDSPLSWLLDNRIIARVEGCSCRDMLSENLHKCSLQLSDFKGVIVCDDLKFMIESVLTGQGIAFVSKALVVDHLDKRRLVAHSIEGFNHFRRITVAIKQEKCNDDKIRSLLGAIVDITKIAAISPFLWLPLLQS